MTEKRGGLLALLKEEQPAGEQDLLLKTVSQSRRTSDAGAALAVASPPASVSRAHLPPPRATEDGVAHVPHHRAPPPSSNGSPQPSVATPAGRAVAAAREATPSSTATASWMQQGVVQPPAAKLPAQALKKIERLDDDQRRAATAPLERPLAIVAGAGSGKTTTLEARIVHILRTCNLRGHEQILCVSFTKKSADEIRERLCKTIGGELMSRVHVKTFHGIAAEVLRRYSTSIGYKTAKLIEPKDATGIFKEVVLSLGIDGDGNSVEGGLQYTGPSPRAMPASATAKKRAEALLYTMASYYKKETSAIKSKYLVDPDTHEATSGPADVRAVYSAYQAVNREKDRVDFGDFLLLAVRIFRQTEQSVEEYRRRFRFVLADEFQDTNAVQFDLLLRLMGTRKTITVVGDEDQSIYGFRGSIGTFVPFTKAFGAEKRLLERNYRSTRTIVDASNGVIVNNTERTEKKMWTSAEDGPPIQVVRAASQLEEAEVLARMIARMTRIDKVKPSDIVILYRLRVVSVDVEEALARHGIFYSKGGGRMSFMSEFKAFDSALRAVCNLDIHVSAIDHLFKYNGMTKTAIAAVKKCMECEKLRVLQACEYLLGGHSHLYKLSKDGLKRVQAFRNSILLLRSHAPDHPLDVLFLVFQRYFSPDPKGILSGAAPSMEKLKETINELDEDGDSLSNALDTALTFEQQMARLVRTEIRRYIDEENRAWLREAAMMAPEAAKREPMEDGKGAEEPPPPKLVPPVLSGSLGTINRLIVHFDNKERLASRAERDGQAVSMMTIHQSKGLEWPYVILAGGNRRVSPGMDIAELRKMAMSASQGSASSSVDFEAKFAQFEEERRLFYVAITRAKHRAFITCSQFTKRGHDAELCDFIRELPSNRAIFLEAQASSLAEGEKLSIDIEFETVRGRFAGDRESTSQPPSSAASSQQPSAGSQQPSQPVSDFEFDFGDDLEAALAACDEAVDAAAAARPPAPLATPKTPKTPKTPGTKSTPGSGRPLKTPIEQRRQRAVEAYKNEALEMKEKQHLLKVLPEVVAEVPKSGAMGNRTTTQPTTQPPPPSTPGFRTPSVAPSQTSALGGGDPGTIRKRLFSSQATAPPTPATSRTPMTTPAATATPSTTTSSAKRRLVGTDAEELERRRKEARTIQQAESIFKVHMVSNRSHWEASRDRLAK